MPIQFFREKKASLLQSRYGYKQVKHSAVSEGRREGKQTVLCYHVSTLKSQDLPLYRFDLDQTAKTTEEWIKSKSYLCFMRGTSHRMKVYLSLDAWPLARSFC